MYCTLYVKGQRVRRSVLYIHTDLSTERSTGAGRQIQHLKHWSIILNKICHKRHWRIRKANCKTISYVTPVPLYALNDSTPSAWIIVNVYTAELKWNLWHIPLLFKNQTKIRHFNKHFCTFIKISCRLRNKYTYTARPERPKKELSQRNIPSHAKKKE
jgi:hypothetical protein